MRAPRRYGPTPDGGYDTATGHLPAEEVARRQLLGEINNRLVATHDAEALRRFWATPLDALGGRSPEQVCTGEWDATGPEAKALRSLVRRRSRTAPR